MNEEGSINDEGTVFRAVEFGNVRVSTLRWMDGEGMLAIVRLGEGPEASCITLELEQLPSLIAALRSLAPHESSQPVTLRIVPPALR